MSLYIFIYYIYHLTCLCKNFHDLSALVGCLFSVFIRRVNYTFLNVCPFRYTAFEISGKVFDPINRFDHTSWVDAIPTTDRPKSVLNRCEIEGFFCGVFVLSRCFLDFSVDVGALKFVLESDLFLFRINGPNIVIPKCLRLKI